VLRLFCDVRLDADVVMKASPGRSRPRIARIASVIVGRIAAFDRGHKLLAFLPVSAPISPQSVSDAHGL